MSLFPKFLYFVLKVKPLKPDGYKRHFKKFKQTKIPIPPLEVQEEIVAEVGGYQKIIDGARQVVAGWKPQVKIDADWPMVELGEVLELKFGERITKQKSEGTIFPVYEPVKR